mmetsp:Transcript_26922/g.41718  ORF Transcript_26922/g.41718 Transcript_26922/m.41718 type:complete len:199 (-) Transcript_26922:116-712(-)
MSISLIGRQLSSLRLVQRAVAPSLAATQSAVPTMMPEASLRLMSSPQTTNNHTSQFTLCMPTRNFSSMETATIEHDDGGPVTGGFDATLKEMTNEQLADMSTIPGWNLVHNPPRHNPRGALVGKVVSDKMQKTVNVAVDRYRIVPKYRKRLRYTKKFMAHDEHEVCNVGDLVMIVPSQKISKHKHFMVREIIRAKGQL